MRCGAQWPRALALLVALALCATPALAEKHRKRHRRIRTTTTAAPAPAPVDGDGDAPPHPAALSAPSAPPPAGSDADHLQRGAAERADELRFQEAERTRLHEAAEAGAGAGAGPDRNIYYDDPCLKVHCSAGRVCEIDEAGEAVCNCIRACPYETDSRRKVCTNHNETWASDCEVYRQRCLCLDGSDLCQGPQYHHVQIEYYGACREMPECQKSEMEDFPRRMRDWLFNIMRDLAERRELGAHFLQLERQAESNLTRRWANAAIWKWCDLDAHDNDRAVSRHELFPLRAPLMALEHCIAPFLDACDADGDHKLTLPEWGRCLELDESELEDRCEEVTEDSAAEGDAA